MNKVGLDGQICVEYISSLIELKNSSTADRDAAICDFLHDSVHASSSLRGIAEQNKFVDDTLAEIRARLSGQTTVQNLQPPPPAVGVKAPFKKGVKLSGTALKQVVGNVKPSYVQRYSDDEREAPPPPPPPPRFVSVETMETPVRQSSTNSRRKNRAKEIGPDEDWDDEVKTVWKTPFESPKPERVEIVPKKLVVDRRVEETLSVQVDEVDSFKQSPQPVMNEPEIQIVVLEVKETETVETKVPELNEIVHEDQVKSVLLSPQSLLYSLPTDILSFDFKFEDDEEVEPASSAAPFDLLKQMFEAPPTSVVQSPPPALTPVGKNVYSVPFLLSVLNDLKNANGGLVPVPQELRGLSRTEVSPPRPRADSFGWRSAQTQPEEQTGSWRASGYNNKGPRRTPVAEQGFW